MGYVALLLRWRDLHVTCCTSHFIRHAAFIILFMSHVTRHTSHVTVSAVGQSASSKFTLTTKMSALHVMHHSTNVTRHASHVIHLFSHLARHASRITRHTPQNALFLRYRDHQNDPVKKGKRVTRHTSHVTRLTSHVTRHTSHVTRHVTGEFVIDAMSKVQKQRDGDKVTRHTSHVTRHPSHVTRHTSSY